MRRWPFSTAHLVDEDLSIDFAKYTTPEDRVAVIATQPLTDDEVWTAFEPGELIMFQCGDVAARMQIPVPERVLEKLRNPSLDASASAPRTAREALATAADGDSDDAIDF